MYHALVVTLNWWNSNRRCQTPAVKDPSPAPASSRYERMFGICQAWAASSCRAANRDLRHVGVIICSVVLKIAEPQPILQENGEVADVALPDHGQHLGPHCAHDTSHTRRGLPASARSMNHSVSWTIPSLRAQRSCGCCARRCVTVPKSAMSSSMSFPADPFPTIQWLRTPTDCLGRESAQFPYCRGRHCWKEGSWQRRIRTRSEPHHFLRLRAKGIARLSESRGGNTARRI